MGQKEITREIQKYSEMNNNKNTHIKICGLQPKQYLEGNSQL